MKHTFKALIVEKNDNQLSTGIKKIHLSDLPDDDVLIKISYSSINYKDGLAVKADGKIVKSYPFVPGIDLSGIVVSSRDPRFHEGDPVIATGYDIGVSHFGGFSEYMRLPGDWVVPLPDHLTLEDAMVYGTAGFTAALAVQRLEDNGLTPDQGNVLVTGSTGGVGSLACAMLSKLGYHVVASTGKTSEHDHLRQLGVSEILSREAVIDEPVRPLGRRKWAAAVDSVGGNTLASILGKIQYQGSVAACGLTGGNAVPTYVFPFILRSVNLLGIDSVYCPMPRRVKIWHRLATDLFIVNKYNEMKRSISLDELPERLSMTSQGGNTGRTVVRIAD
ncbi:acryloyl-CoA reductase [Sporolactobacillus sp. THM19-2]|uniref:acrylyl-CoA reductase family protein n=1 Tax=Sporolactobacillus sp. THM19-2 TaxID=2511171 RepID=UPI00101F37BB|nr:acryloyl-CoA reductase [Sporolactobacillus sp. THM19-2]RYL86524.1 acryloyl-CoA reductase [Sporolactobacillus sp. THM19-2]